MDLDDSFTENLLNSRKATKDFLNSRKADSTPIVGKKRSALVEEQQISYQGVSNKAPEESPKRQCIEHSPEKHDHDIGKENHHMEESTEDSFVPFKVSGRGLAALRRKNPMDMNQEEETKIRAASESEVNKTNTYLFSTNSSDMCAARKTRLNNLAANINQWEDDLHRPALSTNNVASKLPLSKPNSSDSNSFAMKLYDTDKTSNTLPLSKDSQSVCSLGSEKGSCMPVIKGNIESGAGKRLAGRLDAWDQAIKATMEAEVKSPVKKISKLNENDSVKWVKQEKVRKEITDTCPVVPMVHKPKVTFNANGLNGKTSDDLNRSLDPAELPLSARKALFEKSAFGGSSKPSEQAIEPKLTIAQRAAMFEKAANKDSSKPKPQIDFGIQKRLVKQKLPSLTEPQPVAPPPPPPPLIQSSPLKSFSVQADLKSAIKNSPVKKTVSPLSPLSPNKEAGNHIRLMQQKLVERAASNWQEKDIVAKAVDERKMEISSLVNHHQKSTSSSSIESNASGQGRPMSLLEEVENSLEYGEEYASEMESEYTERESMSEFDVETQQDEEEVMESSYSDQENQDLNDQDQSVINREEEPDELNHEENPDVFTDEDEALDVVEPELKRIEVESKSGYYRQPEYSDKRGSSSIHSSQSSSLSVGSSFASRSLSVSSNGSNLSSHDNTQEATVENDDKPLQYTVSFYRKQKQATRTPPLKTIVRREHVQSPPSDDNKAQVIQERINILQEEIVLQQNIISQTSQALNLCHATAEFSGSSEQVEGERLLLIATQKRQACLNEIQRLKSHGALKENLTDGAGSLIITDIQLPLKRDFIAAQLEGKLNDAVHCFLCLIRHGAQVIVTQMMSTDDKISDGSLCFTNHIKLQNLPPDLSVVFEVYALQTKKEQLPHDKKYHIKREQSKIRITPKGKKADSKLILPAISSPGGPNAVRSSSFGVVGFTRFTTQSCHKRCFTLDKVPFTSPLEGILKVKLQLHAEHKVKEKGFLTMFEVVADFGAWHRRWCYLNSQYLALWKYPDDENKKEPIGMIDLKKCVTGQVKLIARDICARQNTFELLTIRPREKGDASKDQGNSITTIKHLLSADTREERILWCNKLNEALTNVRKWDAQALRPIETEQTNWSYPTSK